MSDLKLGRKTKWENIKVGEIYAFEGCWEVRLKLDTESSVTLAEDWWYSFDEYERVHQIGKGYVNPDKLYKLPLSVQRLWHAEAGK